MVDEALDDSLRLAVANIYWYW